MAPDHSPASSVARRARLLHARGQAIRNLPRPRCQLFGLASWRKLNAEGWGYFDDDAPSVGYYRCARETFVPVETIALLIAQAALPLKREPVLLWHFHPLDREPRSDGHGLCWGPTHPYGSAAACAAHLGVSVRRVRAATRVTPLPLGFKRMSADEDVTCYRWRRRRYYPVKRIAALLRVDAPASAL